MPKEPITLTEVRVAAVNAKYGTQKGGIVKLTLEFDSPSLAKGAQAEALMDTGNYTVTFTPEPEDEETNA